jgi:pSer/pThr/pTyr-binding forkhead associated (FHA) protein
LNQRKSSGWVLKFISGKYQGGEFPLEMDNEIVIGRSSDLDMVLVEDMVSRRHARITTYGGEIYLEDFGSTNGSFVNGEKITKARLKEGDRILVGTNIIKLVHRDSEEGAGKDMRSGMGTDRAQASRTTGATLTGSISGLIEEVPLPDLLQLFATSKKSGVLVIHRDDDSGKIYLREGRVIFAVINNENDVSPYKTFYRLMGWTHGTFSLEHPTDETFENEINESTEGLMMEGMRIMDEMENLGADVPSTDASLRVNSPLVAPLRNLTPEMLDTFQLCLNYGKVGNVLNRSLSGDLETMQDIVFLIRNDYIKAID